jgi:hypothetical protein
VAGGAKVDGQPTHAPCRLNSTNPHVALLGPRVHGALSRMRVVREDVPRIGRLMRLTRCDDISDLE